MKKTHSSENKNTKIEKIKNTIDYKVLPEYIRKTYNEYKKRHKSKKRMTKTREEEYTTDLLIMSNFYNTPKDTMIGLATYESRFINKNNDEDQTYINKEGKRVPNPSESIYNMSRKTQEWVIDYVISYLKNKGYDFNKLPKGVRPKEYVIDLNGSPKRAATYAGALFKYYMIVGQKKGMTKQQAIKYAIKKWNPNGEKYVENVEKYTRKYQNYKINYYGGCGAKNDIKQKNNIEKNKQQINKYKQYVLNTKLKTPYKR